MYPRENIMEYYGDAANNNLLSLNCNLSSIVRKNPVKELPLEISIQIFSELKRPDLKSCRLVCGEWNSLANVKEISPLWKMPENAFGPKQWKEHFGVNLDIKDVAPLPLNIHEILEEDCPFFRGKKVKDSHMLTLIPEFSLESFTNLLKSKYPEFVPDVNPYFYYNCLSVEKSHWILMTKDIIPNSSDKLLSLSSYRADNCHRLIQELGDDLYELPYTLEVIIAATAENIRSVSRLFEESCTFCKDAMSETHLMRVGNYFKNRILVTQRYCYNFGVAGVRKFEEQNFEEKNFEEQSFLQFAKIPSVCACTIS